MSRRPTVPAAAPHRAVRLPLLVAALAGSALALPGCFTPRTTERMRLETMRAVQEGDFAKADGTLNELFESHLDGEPEEPGGKPVANNVILGKQALLWHMERGMVDHLSGDLLASNRHLDAAGDLVDLRRVKGLVTEATTFLANDTVRDYAGNAFEHTQVDYYRALNRLLQAERREGTFVPSQLTFTPPLHQATAANAPVPFALNTSDNVSAADNIDRAIGFARRMTINQLQETADAAGGNRYDDDPYARFMAAALTYAAKPGERTEGNRQFADVMLKRAMQAYDRQAATIGNGKQPFRYEVGHRPRLVETLFIRHARAYDRESFDANLAQFHLRADDPRLTTSQLPPGHGMVLVLNHVGYITHPEVLDIRAVLAQFSTNPQPTAEEAARGVSSQRFYIGGALFWAKGPGADVVNHWAAIPVPGDIIKKALAPGGAAFMGFAIPVHATDHPIATPLSVRAKPAMGGPEATSGMEVLSDLDAFARATLKDEQPGVVAKTLIRAVGKQFAAGQLAHEVEHNNRDKDGIGQLLGMAVNLIGSTAATLSEVADTRAWTTLPDHIDGALLDLPPGHYTLTLDTAAGPIECGGVTVEADRLVVVPIRTFPDLLPKRD